MARFVDLDLEEDEDETLDRGKPLLVQNGRATAETPREASGEPRVVRNAITEAFHCYPIVVAIVSHIDLNTLDALARTSRLIHDGLIQFRTTLLARTLRCGKEVGGREDIMVVTEGRMAQFRDGEQVPRSGPGHCARDMVGECRRCGEVTCRNCAIKPPASTALLGRHRRLCSVCADAPLGALACPPLDPGLPACSDFVQRSLCQCHVSGVWLCQACGRGIRASDYDYKRLWRWRRNYGELVGGLGTGIGEGDRGVICGRGTACLAARDREYEMDCDAEDRRLDSVSTGLHDDNNNSNNNNSHYSYSYSNNMETLLDEHRRNTPSPQLGPGYARHEIEGIGGVVKRKLIKMVSVGACVPEWQEERGGSASGGKVMAREVSGASRSWCGWCNRAIPGRGDMKSA